MPAFAGHESVPQRNSSRVAWLGLGRAPLAQACRSRSLYDVGVLTCYLASNRTRKIDLRGQGVTRVNSMMSMLN